MKTIPLLLLAACLAASSAPAAPQKNPNPFGAAKETPPATQPVTTGLIDTTPWAKWVKAPPEVLLVRPLDPATERLITRQVALFTALVEEPKAAPAPAAPAPDLAGKLAALKARFPAKGKERVAGKSGLVDVDVPAIDTWNKYRRMLDHASLTNLGRIASEMETAMQRDLRDLPSYPAGETRYEARVAAIQRTWITKQIPPLIAEMKRLDAPTTSSTAPDAKESARKAWSDFESTDLAVMQKVIAAAVLATAAPDAEGRFSLEGDGRLMARVHVAGRDLYFPADAGAEGVRFFDVQSKRAAPAAN